MNERMAFIGVTTGSSSIMKIFPAWADELELPTRTLEGVDIALDADDAAFRAAVERIKRDAAHRGALVTTHKMSLYTAAHDLFDELDEFAVACGEISSISKRNGRLLGHAKDPITATAGLDELFPAGGFGGEREAIILGAGGAGLALSWGLAEREDLPSRIVVTDTSRERLQHLLDVHAERGTPRSLLEVHDAHETAGILASAPEGSLVVNASGLGKDRPGSPVPDGTFFPRAATVWEFNYRGSLEFLQQAREQESSRDLRVFDGWRYFIHGWTQVIGEVFDVEMTGERVDRLAEIAEGCR
ncbi:MAG TPA: shikimate dehydrogenase [Candidatus Agrococcus pullicola]|uniref:Shikimate dehydrogenase n=1 Tax=Candidatus Agrococcus pullicola TaxID=2838429 RepID=A0A9D1YXT1_9MICO|nr:shikimate dehydrogenase [Candidatus Agrococcus pullicola]